eukprot:15344695-Ditylum_brightwellii.AAC.1
MPSLSPELNYMLMTSSFTSRDQKDEETTEQLLCGYCLVQVKVGNTAHATSTKEVVVPFYSSSTSMTKMIHV